MAAFVALALATVAAFFVTQALKVTTPLIAGSPAPVPGTIDPIAGGTCQVRNHAGVLLPVSFKRTTVSFYLLNRADDVDVYIIDQDGDVVATLPGSGRHMRVKQRRSFTWDGRVHGGGIAPDGVYDVRVWLVNQGRGLLIARNGVVEPVTVETRPPPLAITSVSPGRITSGSATRVTIRYAGNQGRRPLVRVYRLGAGGAHARLVKTFAATSRTGTSVWDGTLAGGAAAPPGTYLIGLAMTDRTCEPVSYPRTPTAAAAPHALVTVH